jgi:glutamate formiminotransferase / formiminotetrahydrofolate cyclodeaminase
MKKIVECVPNFSDGRNQETIDAIARAIQNTDRCRLLDVDPGSSTNRTVYTFVGDPEAVIEGALAAARVASERIDMRLHHGEHPRMGALDVCPFIPVAGVTMEDCVEIARTFGLRLAQDMGVPVYLYGEAASQRQRRDLPFVRQGEYEGLERRFEDPQWKPDFGPTAFVPRWGATAAGARPFLIAYNVNLLCTANQAHRIALNLREAGRGPKEPGRLRHVRGMGWFVGENNIAQVSVNLTDYTVTPMHVLYEEVLKEAASLKIGVVGSEAVGLVPLEAMLMAAEYYIEKEKLFILDEDQKVRLAINRLGLNTLAPFNPDEKIIEYIVSEPPVEPLASMSLRRFIEEVAARSSAPGGGSVSAATAALGAALGTMAAKLTYGVRRFEHVDEKMRQIIPPLHEAVQTLIPLIDQDTVAFKAYMDAQRSPSSSSAEKEQRHTRMQQSLKAAMEVPLETMRVADTVWSALCEAAGAINPASKSDVQVSARCLETGIWGAHQNVKINLEDIEDAAYRERVLAEARSIVRRAREKRLEILTILDKR